MKEGWEYKKLGNICNILNGFAFKSSTYVAEGIRVIRISNVQKGIVEDKDPKFFPLSCKREIENYLLNEGDLLISLTGNVGRVGLLYKELLPAALNQRVACLRLKDENIKKQYLFHFLNSNYFEDICIKNSKGAAQLNMSTVWLSNYAIPIPSLSEQQSIVDYLDSTFAKIDAMKANAEKALNEAKALFQASLKEMLEPKEGWEEQKIKEICETVTDFVAAGSFASLRENVIYNNEKDYAQLVRTTDLKSGFTKGGYVYVNEHAFKYLYRVNLDEECIILPNVGVNCGEVYYVTPSLLPYNNNVLGPNAVLVRSNKYNNHFLSYLFLGKDFQKKLSDITSHMAQPKFNKTGLKEIVISVPLLSEQQSIVETLDSLKSKVDLLQENYNKISQECDALKQAILRQVFE